VVRLDAQVLDHFEETGVQAGSANVREEMLRRAQWLDERDRALVQLSVKGNLTLREMAGVVGLPAGSISRRLARVRARLQDRVVNALLDSRAGLPKEFREVGLEYFLTGMPLYEIADRHRMPIGQVRRIVQFIKGWQKGRVAVH
jgi:DNA-directed RNA polymerase specialized sigma24 family protein